jgi:hypothetical protein
VALVATVRAGFTKYRGQLGRRFLHLYRLSDGRGALIREHYSKVRSYQCIASRNLCQICRQPYEIWLRLRAGREKSRILKGLPEVVAWVSHCGRGGGRGLGEHRTAKLKHQGPQWRLKLYYSPFWINDRGRTISTFDVAVAASFIPVMGRSISLSAPIIFGILRLGVSGCRQVRVID